MLRRPATVGPTCSLRRRLPLRPRFRINRRLSSATNSRRLPTCADCRLSPTADLRRLPTFRRRLPTQPPTLIGVRSNGPFQPIRSLRRRPIFRFAIRSISGLRLRPTLRPSFPNDLRLAPPIDPRLRLLTGPRLAPPADPSAMPSDEPPACAFDPSSGSTFQSTSSLRLRFNLPALPLNLTSDSHRSLHRRLRLVPTSGLRLRSTLGCAFGPASDRRRVPTFQLCLPDGLRLAPTANLPALPSKQLPTPVNCCALGAAVRSTVDLRHRSTVRPCL